MGSTAANAAWRRLENGYAPIGDYAIIGDTLTTALVASDGSIDWLCLPNPDSPAIFTRLLDRHRGGHFLVQAAGATGVNRWYVDRTAILQTRHSTRGGILQITDFMPVVGSRPNTIHPQRRVIRIVDAVAGRPEVSVSVAPRLGYGASVPQLEPAGRLGWRIATGGQWLLIRSEIPLEQPSSGELRGRERLTAGDRRILSLDYSKAEPGIIAPLSAAAQHLEETRDWWQSQICGDAAPAAFRPQVLRSLIVLRLLNFSHSGAVIAAPTLGLPETVGGIRNYDYRFCWLRDASFVLHAFMQLGLTSAARRFFRWMMQATHSTAPRLGTFYSIFGRAGIRVKPLKNLAGYRNSAPVRAGNAAQSQLQLDAYGSIVGAARIFVERGGTIKPDEARRLAGFARQVVRDWSLPDNGLWEVPDPRRHYSYSKAMCWSALKDFIWLCEAGAIDADPAPFRSEADRQQRYFLDHAWNPRINAFSAAFGEDWLDASLLLLPRIGIVEARDPRMSATFEAMRNRLGEGAQIRRYDDGIDGIPGREGSFTACGFWAADYLARAGRLPEARAQIEAMLEYANDLGLMSEELDPETGAQLGNFPQGFSHAGLITAVMTLEKELAEERKGGTS
jgi:GH15 family glucan-1,4-alpha-glucosidase